MDVAKKEEGSTHIALLDKGGAQDIGKCTASHVPCTGENNPPKPLQSLHIHPQLSNSLYLTHHGQLPWHYSTAPDLFAEPTPNAPLKAEAKARQAAVAAAAAPFYIKHSKTQFSY